MKKLLFLMISSVFFLSSCGNDDEKSTDGSNNTEDLNKLVNVKAFENVKVAFADGMSQSAEGSFSFPTDIDKIKTIKMYIKDICPNKTCDEWDRYANVYVKDKTTGQWLEIGRFITPYWVGTEKLPRGLEVDVTDFKSLLSGTTELKIYTETWLAKGRTYTVDFDVQYGTPDYKYSAIVPVMQYNHSSIDGVPYGKPHDFDLTRQIQVPSGIEKAHFRTIISGWGHATPNDSGGRGCAEWCYRTHHIHLNNAQTYAHSLESLNCAQNPINNQSPGNWQGNRAGWCPGMIVPVRLDNLANNLIGSTFSYEYKFSEWINNMGNGEAYYAISTFLVVKSNQPITLPTVTN